VGKNVVFGHQRTKEYSINTIQINKKLENVIKISNAFIAAFWIALGAGTIGYLIGLVRAEMLLNEKGYYAFVFLLAIFGAIAVQKKTRDNMPKKINNNSIA
jgi:uncharacterized membrane protein YiaA